MVIAIISDIHGNLEALKSVLEDIDSRNIDEIICLGDIVGYGVNPNECIDLINMRSSIILLGNHDAAALGSLPIDNFNINAKTAIGWTEKHLTKKSIDFLKALPLMKTGHGQTYVHATPYEPKMWYYINSLEEAAFNFQFFETDFCFVGHTHIPMIINLKEEKEISVYPHEKLSYGESEKNNRYLVNTGSVGQPRDRNPDSCYAIMDTEEKSVELIRVKYNIKKVQAKMKKAKMPDFLISRLEIGR